MTTNFFMPTAGQILHSLLQQNLPPDLPAKCWFRCCACYRLPCLYVVYPSEDYQTFSASDDSDSKEKLDTDFYI